MTMAGLRLTKEQKEKQKELEEKIRDGLNSIEVKAQVSGTEKYSLPDMVDITVRGMFPSQARRLVKFIKEEL
jgi:cysteine sulfinate desulfinase/cysteine desulfurase-like protein